MTAIVIGSNLTAMVASYAIAQAQPMSVQMILAPIVPESPEVKIFGPLNGVIPAALPAFADWIPTRNVRLRATGSAATWPDKVGNPAKIAEHFPTEATTFAAHSHRDLFLGLLPRCARAITGWDVARDPLDAIAANFTADLIINTAPRELFCQRPDDHGFARRQYWISHSIGPSIGPNEIVVNSEDAPAWYVTSKLGDMQETRWLVKPPFSDVAEDSYPLSTNCDCAPHGMVHIGVEAECNPLATLSDVYSSAYAAAMQAGD